MDLMFNKNIISSRNIFLKNNLLTEGSINHNLSKLKQIVREKTTTWSINMMKMAEKPFLTAKIANLITAKEVISVKDLSIQKGHLSLKIDMNNCHIIFNCYINDTNQS